MDTINRDSFLHHLDSFREPHCSGNMEGSIHASAEGEDREPDAPQTAMPMQSTLGQWLRTCASATDLEVASMLSMAPSQVSAKSEAPHAAPGTPQRILIL